MRDIAWFYTCCDLFLKKMFFFWWYLYMKVMLHYLQICQQVMKFFVFHNFAVKFIFLPQNFLFLDIVVFFIYDFLLYFFPTESFCLLHLWEMCEFIDGKVINGDIWRKKKKTMEFNGEVGEIERCTESRRRR